MKSKSKLTKQSISVHAGMNPQANHGIPNPPVYHASTILKPSLDDYRQKRGQYDYGRYGTPTTQALEQAVAALYGSDDALAVPSGLGACSFGVLAVVKAGESVLFPDNLYIGTRRFVENVLPQINVEPIYYDPVSVDDLKSRRKDNTSLIYIETPGSLTFELQDTAAIVKYAKEVGCLTACDNTWGTPLYFDVFGHGIDIAIEAGTKYISGHSDVSIGFIAANGECAEKIRLYARHTGLCVAPDDHYLALRGMRTLALRLKQSEASGLALAEFVASQPEVIAMRHPALKSHPQHDLWKRDFSGSSGLFAFFLDPKISDKAVDAMVDNLALFGIGASWGGHESLISEAIPKRNVSETPEGRLIRIYAGLEDTNDLIADLEEGFKRMRKI